MAADVRAGLGTAPRSIPPKYFYDARGVAPLRRDLRSRRVLPDAGRARRCSTGTPPDIVACIGPPDATALVEIGSGLARKTGVLVRALCARAGSTRSTCRSTSRRRPSPSRRSRCSPEHPSLSRAGRGRRLRARPAANRARRPPSAGPRLFAFLGSTIGNLDEHEAPAFLRDISRLMTGRDRFLLGVDLVKDKRVLEAAYDDARGVTAEFNKNVLRVLSRELDGDFDETAFDHRACYDEELQRIEMHLVSRRAQSVHLRAIDLARRARDRASASSRRSAASSRGRARSGRSSRAPCASSAGSPTTPGSSPWSVAARA